MFPTVSAETFEEKQFAGRNKAILLGCVDEAGKQLTCVVKLAHRLENRETFWTEWSAGLLADELDVYTPERFVVDVSEGLAAIIGRKLGEDARASVGANLGVRYLRDTFVVPNESVALDPHYREAAAKIAAFDVFIDNPDRLKTNPNCLVDAGTPTRLVAIDHDLAFTGFYLPMLGSNWPSDILAKHLFAHRFGKNTPDLSGTKAAIAGLTDAFLEELQRNVPPQWLTASATSKLSTTVVKLEGAARRGK